MKTLKRFAEKHGYLFSILCVIIATTLFSPGRDYFAKGQWAFLYLLIVGLVAGFAGVKPALLTAILAFFTWNFFFLPPYNTFRIHDPKDWLSLFVFLVVAVEMGMQTGRMREHEAEARAHEREMSMLNQFSAHLVSDAPVADIAKLMMSQVMEMTHADSAAVYLADVEGKLYELLSVTNDDIPMEKSVNQIAEWAYKQSKAVGLPKIEKRSDPSVVGWPISATFDQAGAEKERKDLFIPLQTAEKIEGILYIGPKTNGHSYCFSDVRPLIAMANQATAFFERKRLQSVAVRAEALIEANKLKSTLISSVSHELKTPIASIMATISNLTTEDMKWDAVAFQQELASVQDDLDRLTNSINALLNLSRLESEDWKPKMEWFDLADVIWAAVSKIPQKQRSRIEVNLPNELPMVRVDLMQIASALENLLINSLTYGPQDVPVKLGASEEDEYCRIWVEDKGPGIAPDERERIFEKFYRGKSSSRFSSGTGLGLAVSREIVHYHGGRIWVEDAIPHGARFVISLPIEKEPQLQ